MHTARLLLQRCFLKIGKSIIVTQITFRAHFILSTDVPDRKSVLFWIENSDQNYIVLEMITKNLAIFFFFF